VEKPVLRPMNRRHFLSTSALAAASLAAPVRSFAEASQDAGSFDFIFLTDTHIQPELAAADGCAMCFKKIRSSFKVDFAIQGGDHVFDSQAVNRQRATSLFDLYARTEQDLGLKVHHVIGNHDVFGLDAASGINPSDPGYGKQMYQERVGQTYYSFDHKGYHFIVLDSIQMVENRGWIGGIEPAQITWLKKDLDGLKPGTPIVVTVHVPILSGAVVSVFPGPNYSQLIVTNGHEVLSLFKEHNVLAVFQGHLHINEVDTFKGIPFITGGAVSGNWWHGTHEGTPEGFTVVSLREGKITWRYETYGFKSIEPRNT
jgi:3',5'-cyclic-AMP phosphodiesterase